MRKNNIKSDKITFDEFIDIITENKGDEIKKQLRIIERDAKNV